MFTALQGPLLFMLDIKCNTTSFVSCTLIWCCCGQVLNGAIAAALFNLLYDVLLSQKVKWYAMCPVIDFLNHRSSVQVRPL